MIIETITEVRKRFLDVGYLVLRVMAGLLFLSHGAQKLFGAWTDAPPVRLTSLMGVAGVVEFFGGLLILVGLFTWVTAFLASGEMVVAFVKAHLPQGPWPILNHGELALLYSAVFFFIFFMGGGRFSLDTLIARTRGRERGRRAPDEPGDLRVERA